ncbi:glutamate receptor ionotropic, kainate 3-like [Liolophura sinensis]|uniref:glutamate receptor ionotropic, kainate 3-like n=1 Tax=Liolophura sinensis TaxID=3198878 RepID=UPI0031599584
MDVAIAVASWAVVLLGLSVAVDAFAVRRVIIGCLASSRDDPSVELARQIADGIEDPQIQVKGIYKEFNNSFDEVLSAFEFLTSENISAVVGPFQETYEVITESLKIPYLATTWVPLKTQSLQIVQIYPDAETFEAAVVDVVNYYSWSQVTVIYDSKEGSHVIEQLLHRRTIDVNGHKVSAVDSQEGAMQLKETLIQIRDRGRLEIVVVCSPSTTHTIIKQGLYLGLLSTRNKWLIVNMGTEEANLTDFVDSNANVTILSVNRDEEHNSSICHLGFSQSILHDAIHVYAAMTRNVQNKTVTVHGCTGALQVIPGGTRGNQFLQLYTLDGLRGKAKGTWTSGANDVKTRIDFNRTYSDRTRTSHAEFGRRTLIVTTKIEKPYVQWKRGFGNSTNDSTDHLEGYCIDILRELAYRFGFKYSIYLVPDGKFGSLKDDGWTGMIRELKDKETDIAMAPFSVTPERSQVVDFTKPFQIKGTSTIVKIPERHVSVFQFLAPLSKVVWVSIFISFLAASFVLFAISRINSDRKPKTLDNFRECFWYIWAALLRGGTSGVPNATSSRTLSSAWWFFSLIVVAIYTANLAAFLTLTNVNIPINSAADLASQNIYDYGTVDGSQIEYFFKHTKISAYEKMYAHMSVLSPESMVRRVEHGLERVRKEKYAFLWDSPTLRYMIQSRCDLLEIGSPFDLKGYGWAVQKDAPYKDALSLGLLRLNDEGYLQKFEKRWWGRSGCPDMKQTASTKELEFKNVAGIFLVLAGGVILSALLCVANFIIYKRKEAVKSRKKVSEENAWPLKSENNSSKWYPDSSYS